MKVYLNITLPQMEEINAQVAVVNRELSKLRALYARMGPAAVALIANAMQEAMPGETQEA